MIDAYVARYGLEVAPERLRAEALEWATTRGHRSGRTAFQYIQDLAGRLGRALDETGPEGEPSGGCGAQACVFQGLCPWTTKGRGPWDPPIGRSSRNRRCRARSPTSRRRRAS